jgi:tetratricopeptide (TPR) repeat protein
MATCASCSEAAPDTPTAPTIFPSTWIGIPPSSGLAPLSLSSRRLAPPWPTRSVEHLGGTPVEDRSAYDQAVAHTDRALEALARLPESRQTLKLAVTIRTDSGRCAGLFSTGQRERLLENIGEALTLAERLGDERRLALTTNYFANALWFSGENVRALEFCRRASKMAVALGDTATQVVSNLDLGMISASLGDHRGAVAFLDKSVALLHGDLARNRFGRALYPSVTTRSWLADSLAELGEFRQAIAVAEEGLRIAEDLGQPGSILLAQRAASDVLIRRGEFRDAIPRLERCLSLVSTGAFAFLYPWVAGWLGHAYAMTGQQGEGLPLLEQAAERSGRGNRVFEAGATAYLGEVYLLAGRPHDAQITAERALSLSRERAERGVEARALYVLGEITAHDARPSDAEAAERHYRGALALAQELGMRPLVAHCQLGLGKLSRRVGKRVQAHEHLTAAATMYHEMEMPFWLEKAKADAQELA